MRKGEKRGFYNLPEKKNYLHFSLGKQGEMQVNFALIVPFGSNTQPGYYNASATLFSVFFQVATDMVGCVLQLYNAITVNSMILERPALYLFVIIKHRQTNSEGYGENI